MPFPDAPGEPGTPEAQEVGADFVSLQWERPRNDGGGKIKGYYIEKKDSKSDNWARVNALSPCLTNIFNIPNLIEDRDYDFRVIAVNDAGESKPAMTSRSVKVKDPNAVKLPIIRSGLKATQATEGRSCRLEIEV